MIVEEWDYLGHKQLDLPNPNQEDWNSTILTKFNIAFDRLLKEKLNHAKPGIFYILISSEKLEILNSYSLELLKMRNIEIVELLIDNDNVYLSIYDDLHKLDENNCAIVKILNYEK